jgi:CMP-N-acetylneuraminic acid synthetase
MSVIAVITARSRSKSIPNKNIRKLGGVPLLSWVTKAATNSKLVDAVIFSSDSDKYYGMAQKVNPKIIFHKRNRKLAQDVPSELVLLDVLKKFKTLLDAKSIIVLIQPTTPFITSKNIDACIKKLKKNPKVDTCISVKKVDEHPEWMLVQKQKNSQIYSSSVSGKKGVRQNLAKRFVPNGGVYAVRAKFLIKSKKVIANKTAIYEMPKIQSIDIDEENDFAICESLVKSGLFKW